MECTSYFLKIHTQFFITISMWFLVKSLSVWSICLRPGDLVGIKSKCCGVSDNAYRFCTGEEITFENITWTRQARGVLRGGFSKIRCGLKTRIDNKKYNIIFLH